MPGLLRGMARTAVVAGTATAVSNRVSRRQARRWGAQDTGYAPEPGYQQAPPEYQQAPPQQAAPENDVVSQLRELAGLRDQGILTDEEFAAQKAKLLA
jgi:Short C-terminal domain